MCKVILEKKTKNQRYLLKHGESRCLHKVVGNEGHYNANFGKEIDFTPELQTQIGFMMVCRLGINKGKIIGKL